MRQPSLGTFVREITSGYEGHVTGVVDYLWGCRQMLVTRADKDGKPESAWFDVSRLEPRYEIMSLTPIPYDVTETGEQFRGKRVEVHQGADKPPPTR